VSRVIIQALNDLYLAGMVLLVVWTGKWLWEIVTGIWRRDRW